MHMVGWLVARFDAVRLFVFLILWTLQQQFTLQLSARTLQCLFEGVSIPQCFTLPGLDQGWTQCPALNVVLYQVVRVSVKKVSVTLLFYFKTCY